MTDQLRNTEEQAQSLANYLPGGKLFSQANVHDSTFRKLIRGLAGELVTADGYLHNFSQEIIPDETVLFIDEWEQAVGIPDDCFPGTGSTTERRLHVLVKLASLGVQTVDDFEALATLLGATVQVISGHEATSFPLVFPWVFFSTVLESRFTIIVTFTVQEANRFPFTYPIVFGDDTIAIIECLFTKLKPANCAIIFQQV